MDGVTRTFFAQMPSAESPNLGSTKAVIGLDALVVVQANRDVNKVPWRFILVLEAYFSFNFLYFKRLAMFLSFVVFIKQLTNMSKLNSAHSHFNECHKATTLPITSATFQRLLFSQLILLAGSFPPGALLQTVLLIPTVLTKWLIFSNCCCNLSLCESCVICAPSCVGRPAACKNRLLLETGLSLSFCN